MKSKVGGGGGVTVKGVGVLQTRNGVLVKGAPPGLEDRESGVGCETMEDTTGEGVSGSNTDVSSVVEVSVLSREEFCRGLYTSDGFILMAMACGLYVNCIMDCRVPKQKV